ncbi:uncharacterized protein LOC144528865 isoform X2 [Sander vitreus]
MSSMVQQSLLAVTSPIFMIQRGLGTTLISPPLWSSAPASETDNQYKVSSRFSVGLMQRSLALKITGVEERDLGLYYCIANVNTRLTVGRGTILQVSSVGSSWFLCHHWYCVGVGFGLLIMVLAVCITHWKTKSNKETTNKTTTVYSTKNNNTNSS